MATPVLFVIDDDRAALARVMAELQRRYDADYRIVSESSAAAALQELQRLREEHQQVAVVLANLWLGDQTSIELLKQARHFHPNAQRILLVEWGQPAAARSQISRAVTLGEVDNLVSKPSRPGDEHFHQAISGFLWAWTQRHQSAGMPPVGIELVRVIGEQWAGRSHELRDILSRNNIPFGFYPTESETARQLLGQAGIGTTRWPVVVTYDGQVLVDPSIREVAAALGMRTKPDSGTAYDLLIVGAGPAGIAAAVYAASEGLRLTLIEREAIGGQAASSSAIRNYPGFPHGISGAELTSRMAAQAAMFGGEMLVGEATCLRADGHDLVLTLDGVGESTGRAIILATGGNYRRLDISALDRLVGKGIFYGAAASEAAAMAGRRVYVVGGANSAGQAALHLSQYADQVGMLVRGGTLAETMSDYLIRQIESTPNITVHYKTEILDGQGSDQLIGLTLRHQRFGHTRQVPADALFILIGAEPHTQWLPDSISRDPQGFILTGPDLGRYNPPPSPFETSMPGVFAIGDVRHGSVKRVANAVGEASVAVRLVHDRLHALAAAPT